jgi:hypothetical protein
MAAAAALELAVAAAARRKARLITIKFELMGIARCKFWRLKMLFCFILV